MIKQKTAMISGITGQDGGYLAKFLLGKGYRIIGLYRRGATDTFTKLKEHGILEQIELKDFDLLEFSNICRLLKNYQPDEFYNLAAQSFVAASFEEPIYTTQADGMGVLHILEAIREFSPHTKLYQASTSEMFGKVQEIPQKETTPFYPRSPYGVAKLTAHWMCVNYRESFNVFAASGILFNHESPMRGDEFVTRKITKHFARMLADETNLPVELGNLNAKRDWGFAGDYVEMMWLMLQQDKPDTYVIATGETHSIREFCEEAGKVCGWDIEWSGENENETGIDRKTGKMLVKVNPLFYRPAEVEILIGDPSKAEKELGWQRKTDYKGLCRMMTEADIARMKIPAGVK
ncbi:MAG: GDP-mannose 4,6-dehydratase [Heliobacteriaceae bacterium]|jgi:GDPmannose 4,6-dehydratase|nr:GDP-mannose 4,6-dehydratase [Heliobacteriaceae bacterium]